MSNLVLSRKVGDTIIVNNEVTITVRRLSRSNVRLSFSAANDIPIVRGELVRIDQDIDTQLECEDLP